MREGRSKRAAPPEAAQRRRVLEVAKEVSAVLGSNYFRSLVLHLANALGADCVYVGELVRIPTSRIRTLAVCRNREPAEDFEQDLPGTASAQVLADGALAWSANICQLFPFDDFLEQMHANGYVGMRLSDSVGQVSGLMAAVYSERLRDVPLVKSVLEAFVPRTAAELERKRADDALRESEERYRVFVAANSDGMWRIEFERPIPTDLPEDDQMERIYRHGYVAECNAAMSKLIGAESAEELIGVRFEDLAARAGPGFQQELRSTIRSGYRAATVEATRLDASGRNVYRLRSHWGIVENQQLHRIWGTTRDVTELRRAEQSLRAAEERFRELLEGVELLALTLDAHGRVTFCNDWLLAVAQLAKEQLTGKEWLERIDSAEERGKWEAVLSAGSGPRASGPRFEGTIHRPDGSRRLIAWDTIAMRNADGEAAGLAAIGRDITDQREMEARILQADKFDSIGRLAAGIAHDFNNLLTVIMGESSALMERTDRSDPKHATLAGIRSAADRCAWLTQQLMAIGRSQHLQPELLNLNAVVAGEEAIIRNLLGPRIELITDLEPDLGPVFADPSQIRRVFANLATNARDAMPGGGKLAIASSNLDVGPGAPAALSGVPAGSYVRLLVTDTGSGLTEAVKAHIFDPFFTTKKPGKGTGLGLAIVYGIVTQTGGSISVHEAPEGGTRFEILLPRAQVANQLTDESS
jgi:PAS domain S-box-containing protein